MIELFLSFIVFFVPFTILGFILPSFQIGKFFLIAIQFILNFILFDNYFYKKHMIWKDEEYAFAHKLPFPPINNIELLNNGELDISSLYDYNFSTIWGRNYNKKCRNNFYINSDICPISHIIVENNSSKKYDNYTRIQISNSKFLYYTRNSEHELLYENIITLTQKLNFSGVFLNFTKYYEVV